MGPESRLRCRKSFLRREEAEEARSAGMEPERWLDLRLMTRKLDMEPSVEGAMEPRSPSDGSLRDSIVSPASLQPTPTHVQGLLPLLQLLSTLVLKDSRPRMKESSSSLSDIRSAAAGAGEDASSSRWKKTTTTMKKKKKTAGILLA
jgi:hypothetical protein